METRHIVDVRVGEWSVSIVQTRGRYVLLDYDHANAQWSVAIDGGGGVFAFGGRSLHEVATYARRFVTSYATRASARRAAIRILGGEGT